MATAERLQGFIVSKGENKNLPNTTDGFAILCFKSYNSDHQYTRYKQIAFDMFYGDRNYARYGYQTGSGFTWGSWISL